MFECASEIMLNHHWRRLKATTMIYTKRALNMLHMRESPAGIIFANFSCDYFLPEAPFLESFQDGA